MRLSRALVAVIALSLGSAAVAQDASDDWELIREPRTKTVFAYIPTTTGLTIGLRCVDGAYGAIIGGLPEAARNVRVRTLNIRMGDWSRDTRWSITTDRTAAVADYPAPLARRLRNGGDVSILIPGGGDGGRNLRHDLVLPVSSAAIDETLTACGRPTNDPRDDLLPDIGDSGLPDGVTWSRPPRPTFPDTNQHLQGEAVVSCLVTPEGRLERCEVESEFPANGRFGQAALASTRDARVSSPDEIVGEYVPRLVGFRVNFRLR